MTLELYRRANASVSIEPQRSLTILETQPLEARADLRRRLAAPRRLGAACVLALMIGFGSWAGTAPLAGGAIADGVVEPDGERRIVQHLEGGVIRSILVRDGDLVEAGDPLIVLENARARAKLGAIEERIVALSAEKERLMAEFAAIGGVNEVLWRGARGGAQASGMTPIHFDGSTSGAAAERVAETVPMERVRAIYSRQQSVLESRRALLRAEAMQLETRIDRLRDRISGLETELRRVEARVALYDQEIAAKATLVERQVVAPLALLELQRRRLDAAGLRDRLASDVSGHRHEIAEAETALLAMRARLVAENTERIAEIDVSLAELREEREAERDVMGRTVVAAPVSGRVHGLAAKTEGGVAAPGGRLLDIVPADERLVIAARLSPNDVDIVTAGMATRVRFPAFPSRTTPEFAGEVLSISPDRLVDPATGRPYFALRVAVDDAALRQAGRAAGVIPGMAAEVLVVSEHRTLLEYIAEPVLAVIRRGMRET